MNNKLTYVAYAWFSTLLFGVLIVWIATIPNFEVNNDLTNEMIKVLFRMVLYSFMFLLFYRSLIATFKSTIQRLAHWRSKGEASEDAEFVLIIETLLVIISVLSVILFSVFEQFIQLQTPGRTSDLRDMMTDTLISVMSVLLTSLIVYSVPVLGELEVAMKQYYLKRKKQTQKKRK